METRKKNRDSKSAGKPPQSEPAAPLPVVIHWYADVVKLMRLIAGRAPSPSAVLYMMDSIIQTAREISKAASAKLAAQEVQERRSGGHGA